MLIKPITWLGKGRLERCAGYGRGLRIGDGG